MNIRSLMCRSVICLAISGMFIFASCSSKFIAQLTPTVAPTSTPEKLELVDGELDACQLINLTEVESVLGMKIINERTFLNHTPGCKYVSMADDRVLFLSLATTDVTIKRANGPKKYNSNQFYSAAELYEALKTGYIDLSNILKVEEIENFGDQAFLVKGRFLEIDILKNNIYYAFNTQVDGGIGYEELMKLVKIALQRMP
jgi:hypothetical protein